MSIYVGAGPLRTLAELQRKVQARTAAGGTEVTWVKERDIWCRIKGLSPRLKLEAMAREPQITHEIVVRQELGRDPTPGVLDDDLEGISTTLHLDAHLAARWRELHRVREEVPHDLLQACCIAEDDPRGVHRHVELKPSCFRRGTAITSSRCAPSAASRSPRARSGSIARGRA